jgi:hypothetical protein
MDLSAITDAPYGKVNDTFYVTGDFRVNTIWIPKLICERATGKIVGLRTYTEELYVDQAQWLYQTDRTMERLGLEYMDNSEADILSVTKAVYYKFVKQAPPPPGTDCFADKPYDNVWEPFRAKYLEYGLTPKTLAASTCD